jgi:hypothetical protein
MFCPPNSHVESSPPNGGAGRWGLWEVTGSRGGAPWMGSVSLFLTDPREPPALPPWRTQQGGAIRGAGSFCHQTWRLSHFDLGLPAYDLDLGVQDLTLDPRTFLVHKLPGLAFGTRAETVARGWGVAAMSVSPVSLTVVVHILVELCAGDGVPLADPPHHDLETLGILRDIVKMTLDMHPVLILAVTWTLVLHIVPVTGDKILGVSEQPPPLPWKWTWHTYLSIQKSWYWTLSPEATLPTAQ